MKKSIFMFALATLMSASVFAQDNDAKRLPGYKTTFEGNGFWNNWFMSANFGAQSLFAENSKDAKFRNTITFMPTLSVGKWFNPYWGVRLQGTGGSLHGFTSLLLIKKTVVLTSFLLQVLVEHLFVKATSRLQSMQVSRHVTVSQNVSILTLNTKELSWMTIWWFAVVFRMMESAV